jgi:outer membrane lipoprotein SlyB
MKNLYCAIPLAAAFALGAGSASWAAPGDAVLLAQATYANAGYVDSIEIIHGEGEHHSGVAGAIIGGVIGGVIGHQFFRGTGNTVSTVAGAAGGAVVGNQVDKDHAAREGHDYFRVRVRLDNGADMVINQSEVGDLKTGDRVRVDNDRVYRY